LNAWRRRRRRHAITVPLRQGMAHRHEGQGESG